MEEEILSTAYPYMDLPWIYTALLILQQKSLGWLELRKENIEHEDIGRGFSRAELPSQLYGFFMGAWGHCHCSLATMILSSISKQWRNLLAHHCC